jgi:RNA polymerase sigma-70 factor, ECF subfamily
MNHALVGNARGLPAHRAAAYCHAVKRAPEPACDEDLMLAYRGGDAGAFDELYGRHKAPLYRYLLRQCRDSATAEELFQDIWVNLIRARSTYTVSARFTTYLYKLAHNRLIDHYRRRAPAALVSFDDDEAVLPEPSAGAELEPDRALEVRQHASRLLQLLDALPAAQREAFVLQHETGMSIEDIALATGVTRETAKSRLRYAMAKLREGMRGYL